MSVGRGGGGHGGRKIRETVTASFCLVFWPLCLSNQLTICHITEI